MVDKNTDFFKIIDNFSKTANVPSIQIIKSDLDFKPKVTIAIPTYRRANLLKETIDSAICQKGYENYDIIVVDNDPERGCETERFMLSYNDKRISYYKNSENIGMAGNWNRLFEIAEGEYVVMLHDDDLILSSFLSECFFIVDKEPDLGILNPLKISFSKPLSDEEIRTHIYKYCQNKIILNQLFDIHNYASYALGPPSGCLFNKEAVLKIGGFNNDYFPSFDYFFITLFSVYYKVYVLNKFLTLYRWDCNESLKESTLKGFVINDYFLRRKILKKYKLPSFFANRYLADTSMIFIENCKKMNKDFDFNLEDLNIKKRKNVFLNMNSIIVRIYMKISKLIVYKVF